MTTETAVTTTDSLLAQARKFLLPNYGERTLALVRGQGSYVYTPEGERYLDFLCGLAVTSVGHCHPRVTAAIQHQAATLLHVSNLYVIEPQVRLARMLCERSFAAKAFFCNSGAEAMEAAIKCARRYHPAPERHHIITMLQSFHGRTLATISATGQEKFHKHGFDPYMPGFSFVPLNDASALESAMNDRTAAVIIEPVQAEGGVYEARPEYLRAARRLCDERGALLIFDEIQCGMGRCGTLWAHEESGIEPDMMALAKALGGGMPIGALLCNARTADVLSAGTHGSTFGGNPVSTAAACAVLEVFDEEHLVEKARHVGMRFRAGLEQLAARKRCITEVRGRGLLLGIELSVEAATVANAMRARKVLIGTAGPNVVRFTPPLGVTEDLVDTVLDCLAEALEEVAQP